MKYEYFYTFTKRLLLFLITEKGLEVNLEWFLLCLELSVLRSATIAVLQQTPRSGGRFPQNGQAP